jgi:hypothetical protein
MLCVILRGCWCHIIVLNAHAPAENKIDYVNDSFYEELESVFYKFPKHHMKMLLGDFSAKVGMENVLNLQLLMKFTRNGFISSNEECL